MTLPELVASWRNAKRRADEAKARENNLRVQVIDEAFDLLEIGTSYNADRTLKVVQRLNATMAKADDVVACLAEVSEAFPGLNLGDLVKWSPELNMKEYDALPADARKLFNHVVTLKRGMAALEIVEGKDADK